MGEKAPKPKVRQNKTGALSWIGYGTAIVVFIGTCLGVAIKYEEWRKARAAADAEHPYAKEAKTSPPTPPKKPDVKSDDAKSKEDVPSSNSQPKPTVEKPKSEPSSTVVPPIPKTANEVVVSPLGMGGTYSSIVDAVRRVAPGTVIKVRPGTYRQPLTLNTEVMIVGDGNRGEILIETENGAAVTVVAGGRVTLRGLTISTNSPEPMTRFTAVEVNGGKLTMDDSEVRSQRAAGFHVSGSDAVVNVAGCKINGVGGHTFGVSDGALATLEDSFVANRSRKSDKLGAAILVQSGGKVIARRCQLTKSDVGLRALKEGIASVEDCDLTGNTSSAFDIKPGAKVERLNNKE